MAPTLSVFINISIWSLYILLLCSGVFTHGSGPPLWDDGLLLLCFVSLFWDVGICWYIPSAAGVTLLMSVVGIQSKLAHSSVTRGALSCKALWLRFSVTQFFIKSVCLNHQQIAALSELQITRTPKTILVKHSRGRWWCTKNDQLVFFFVFFLRLFVSCATNKLHLSFFWC